MRGITIALDMDSTVYNLHTPWLSWLKNTHNEECTVEQIETWDWHNQLKCGTKVYDFLDTEGAFLTCSLLPGAFDAINLVASWGFKQFFVSTVKTKQGAWEKQQAIKRDFPELASRVLISSGDKDMIRADVLVDDGPHNIEAFNPHGWTVKIPYRYNQEAEADYVMTDWSQYPSLIYALNAVGPKWAI